MVGMKSFWQMGPVKSTSYATLTMTHQSTYPAIHMYWSTEMYCVIVAKEAKTHFLLTSLASCQGISSKLVMYLTVNTAFIN